MTDATTQSPPGKTRQDKGPRDGGGRLEDPELIIVGVQCCFRGIFTVLPPTANLCLCCVSGRFNDIYSPQLILNLNLDSCKNFSQPLRTVNNFFQLRHIFPDPAVAGTCTISNPSFFLDLASTVCCDAT